ncbi:zinc dependent phospholipase C family protein [Ruegeria sp. THAF33]|uniref:zinc dependent phospholipase C family protein n=1 Tax=Ruegeria sp. THAF33 TaxID=2587853 RepID=UPI0012690ABE|nr:zinc dependent phospholipase C family protein [Ruegeria sp. THAF33]
MPKFGSHIIFAELAAQRRPDLFPNLHAEALRFGAIGPDTTLFMFDPSTSKPELRKGFEVALSVLEKTSDIKEKLNEIEEQLTKPVDDLVDWLSGGLRKDLSYTFNVGMEAMFLATKLGLAWGVGSINVKNPIFSEIGSLPPEFVIDPKFSDPTWVIETTDKFGFPFRMFGHPFTDDGAWKHPTTPGDYSEWWWMDLLHYRHTGDFATNLLSTASTTAQLSYARGYMTHVAGDVTGHPFINRLVGGPFRNHAYRHLVVETVADSWLWNNQGRGDIMAARLDTLISVSSQEENEIAELIVNSMRDVYQPPFVPSLLKNGYPEKDEFLFAYEFLKRYLRLSTNGTIEKPTPPPDNLKEVWKEIKDILKANNPGPPPKWNGSISDFLKSLFSWLSKGAVLLVMIATLPVAAITRIVAQAPRWALYLINSALHFIVSAIRTMLCLVGWGYLSKDDFSSFGFLDDMITTSDNFEANTYPRRTLPNPKPLMYWLVPPDILASVERPATVPIVPLNQKLRPDWMVDTSNVMNPEAEALLHEMGQAPTPQDTVSLESQLTETNGFGNAVDFSIALLEGSLPVYNFDLDGDRGIGFRPWDELPPGSTYQF